MSTDTYLDYDDYDNYEDYFGEEEAEEFIEWQIRDFSNVELLEEILSFVEYTTTEEGAYYDRLEEELYERLKSWLEQ